ncbi:unnamed protein product [Prorocentrum cordatum]|uniref:Uncharacterized protein n=1 Tax=Prorocentrum cordatum TaxID=2364126 RepID=A0ABN9RV48_9DINO|nr:unnamed protein product [Polarella glacialis]
MPSFYTPVAILAQAIFCLSRPRPARSFASVESAMAPLDVARLPPAALAALGGVSAVLAQAGSEEGVSLRRACALVSAAVRGAAQAAVGVSPHGAVEVVQEVVDTVYAELGGDRNVGSAKLSLSAHGPDGKKLAKRLGRASRARNWDAHPDKAYLAADVKKFAEKAEASAAGRQAAAKLAANSDFDTAAEDDTSAESEATQVKQLKGELQVFR